MMSITGNQTRKKKKQLMAERSSRNSRISLICSIGLSVILDL